ncbi:MAG: hypothetical protein HS113_14775 [Verrucomicrobiales bacterium]|nr:hypothetical protein [Verrucomicrobiales bacterium]
MAERAAKKTVAISVKRDRVWPTRTLFTTGFRLRSDRTTGLIEVFLEAIGHRTERVLFDPVLLRGNLDAFKRYAASLASEQDDTAIKDELLASEQATFSNIAHFSRMAERCETVFGLFSFSDWAAAAREATGRAEIRSTDLVVLISSIGFQKKLLLELLVLITEQGTQ